MKFQHLDKRKLQKKLTVVFNAFIRARDRDKPCISCGKYATLQAGHFYSTSQCPAPAMRYDEKNVNGQCVHCNMFLEGNRQGYRVGFLKRYGQAELTALEVKANLRQNPWTAWEYSVVIRHYEQAILALK